VTELTLRAGPARLGLAPALGGAVTRCGSETPDGPVEWLRPASPDALARRDPRGLAAFPLVPYSNRIREGRFTYGGRAVALPPNFPPERHSIHGQGWQAGWDPVDVREASAELEYRHAPDAWPWAYRARQRFRLRPDRLRVELAVANESDGPMPLGVGWHPYFARTPGATLTADVTGMWRTDAETLPVEHVAPAPVALAAGVQIAGLALDNCFTGWRRRAVIEWPEWSARLVLTAERPLDFLVVFVPPGRDFFCVEPVSQVPDALNLAAAGRGDTGLLSLASGHRVAAAVTLAWSGRDA
jgi:aldose 1-epimerase